MKMDWLHRVRSPFFLLILSVLCSPMIAAQTSVSGTLSGAVVWTVSGNPYIVIGDLLLETSASLTIQPGVHIRFDGDYLFEIRGTLSAEGTLENPILMTSNKASPAPGDWKGLFFLDASSSSIMEFCTCEYSGDSNWPAVTCQDVSPRFSHCKFRNGAWNGVQISRNASPVIELSEIDSFANCGISIDSLEAVETSVIGNHITNCGSYAISGMAVFHGNSGSSNGINGMKLPSPGVGIAGELFGDNELAFIGPFQVDPGEILTVEPGAVFKFDDPGWNDIHGELHVLGTEDQPVIFTSFRDDYHAGDTNGDGTTSNPARGDWSGFRLNSSSILDHSFIIFSGYDAGASVVCAGSSPVIRNSQFYEGGGAAIHIDPVSHPVITANYIENFSDSGIISSGTSSEDAVVTNNIINFCQGYAIEGMNHLQNNSGSNNSINGMKLPSGGTGIRGTLYGNNTLAFIGPFQVDSGDSLDIEDGTVIKFDDTRWNYIYGTLNIKGTNSQPVIFTSIKDDNFAGDTNNDGNTTSPLPGDWKGIYWNNTFGNTAEYAFFYFAGYGENPMAALNNTSAGFYSCRFVQSYSYGIYSTGSGNLDIVNCLVEMNGHGIYKSGPVMDVMNCTITGCNGNGIYSVSGSGTITNSIIWNNGTGMTDDASTIQVTYCDVQGGYGQESDYNMNTDPLFTEGAYGSYYLSYDEVTTSPCIDSGSTDSFAVCYHGTAEDICMDDLTATTDSRIDLDVVDLGYHYPLVPGENCYQPYRIECGDMNIGGQDLALKSNNYGAQEYGCGSDFGGGDEVWEMNIGPEPVDIRIILDDSSDPAIDFIVSTVCPPDGNAQYFDRQTFLISMSGTIYFFIDHPADSPGGRYQLSIMCGNLAGEDCGYPLEVECGTCITGSTTGLFDDHGTSGVEGFQGKDAVHVFYLQEPMEVTLSAEADFDADFALSSVCDDGVHGTEISREDYLGIPDPILMCGSISAAVHGAYTYSSLLDAGAYYFWIDGHDAAESGSYAMELHCLASTPTQTPTNTPSLTPSPTPTTSSTFTPIPPTVTPTPTQSCSTTGVKLWMPSTLFREGDPCSCTAFVCNVSGNVLAGYPLFVILEVIGNYYFAPSFSTFDSYLDTWPEFEPGMTEVIVLDQFYWPAGTGSWDGVKWYGALTDPGITKLYGDMDTWTFGWESNNP